MKTFSHKRPVRNEAGEIIGEKAAPASRVTKEELGGNFGADKRKRLVVTLRDGDVVEFRPERTGRTVSMLAVDLYRVVLRNIANNATLERARKSKAAKAERRERAAIARKDRAFSRPQL